MLRFLRVRHLAVIDAVEIEFEAGLNVLTGETGTGKSILVEAVGLLLGGRASADLVRTGEEAASIDAVFELGGREVVVRREITSQGRSRAFVDDELATAGALRDLSARLIEIHGQHEHQTLLDPATHLAVLDAFAHLDAQVARVAAAYDVLRASTEALERLRRAVADRATRQDLAVFQLGELDRAALVPGEDEELAATRQILANAERVERLCMESFSSLYEKDDAVLATLGAVWRQVGELAALDPQFQAYVDARMGIKAQLEDLAMFLRHYAEGIEASPARLAQIEDRLALIERLKRKYGPTLADMIGRRDALRREVDDLAHGDERLGGLEQEHAAARNRYVEAASALSTARRRAAGDFSKRLVSLLSELAMERTRFDVRFAPDPLPETAWTSSGFDQAEFFLSPNPGEDLRPLARIVSGGELSRVMLAIKTLGAESRRADAAAAANGAAGSGGRGGGPGLIVRGGGPGLIFDEIDAGIGGRVADVVGRTLRDLGSRFQVLCITHLPQIAAAAETHFHIDKRVEGRRTRTTVTRLDDNGRVEELGRMLGGEAVTDSIRASAREMMRRFQGGAKGESERAKAKGRSR